MKTKNVVIQMAFKRKCPKLSTKKTAKDQISQKKLNFYPTKRENAWKIRTTWVILL